MRVLDIALGCEIRCFLTRQAKLVEFLYPDVG